MKKGVLYPSRELDCLYFYWKVYPALKRFLQGRELASKTQLKNFEFLKRGTKDKPLFIEDFSSLNEDFFKLRKHHLDEARDKLTNKQQLIWQYFVPRKPVNFFYATNGEHPGGRIDRIFIDIDRQENSSEDARKVCASLVNIIKKDKEFAKLLRFKIFILWTGSSFHIYLLLSKNINLDFYNTYLSYGKGKEKSFLNKWAKLVANETGINVKAGHERERNSIILDSSNTPSGKLARVPFSVHISKGEIDGISVPVSEKEIDNSRLIGKLKKLDADNVLKDLKSYEKLIVA